MDIVFAHGLESHPQGSKARALMAAGFAVTAPDGRGMTLRQRVDGLDGATRNATDILLVGSSYGGLACAWLAARYPERFRGLVLCAPALMLREDPALDPDGLCAPTGLSTVILHGVHDDVVPIEVSRAYRDRSTPGAVDLLELDDGHRLAASLDAFVRAVARFGLPAHP